MLSLLSSKLFVSSVKTLSIDIGACEVTLAVFFIRGINKEAKNYPANKLAY